MIVTATVAYVVAEEMKNHPIYESLLENLLLSRGIHKQPMKRTKILLELVVQFNSLVENQALKDIVVPEKCLIVSIKRGEHDITPNGNTILKSGDYLTVLTSTHYEQEIREAIEAMCKERSH